MSDGHATGGPELSSNQVRTINLALQGGGAHGAFTWGVLDRLLDEKDLAFEGLSATSAGAMNAAARLAMTMWNAKLRQNNPTGKSAKTCPALREKIFRLTRRANHRYNSARLTR